MNPTTPASQTSQAAQPATLPARAAVVGAGTIGLSWVRLLADHGITVRVTDPRADLTEALDRAFDGTDDTVNSDATSVARTRVSAAEDVEAAVADADLVIEAGPERLPFKQELFARIAAAAPAQALLTTSTSGILPTDIARDLPDDVAARLFVAHPFNPPHVLPLVEIVPGERTAPEALARAMDVFTALGKEPVLERREITGFIANRLQAAILRESFWLVQQGYASATDLDRIVTASLGPRWAVHGPLASFHLGGGAGGVRHMLEHLGADMLVRWDTSATPDLAPEAVAPIVDELEQAWPLGRFAATTAARDAAQRAVITARDATGTTGNTAATDLHQSEEDA
ncbi:3-hydroxyacyl-CoA dehydrogenase NAD-binding domain-containing protein [Tersicoccus sp. MR15.9]|uniref:3-hydroxyacyl-CoA dehydrogenase NAD-binding domain-containing protein n=1 Tax=Tersicoccus mangrovi TaxID=3121635 RepID=UPI002FE68DE1